MDVHSRSAIHPLLGRLRIGAPRLWPLSPKLHTSDCSFACPGRSTWVDKVPSRDTPSLNLADRRGGVHPDNPQVARNQSSTWLAGPAHAASPRDRGPSAPSFRMVTGVRGVAPRQDSTPRSCCCCRSASAGTLPNTTPPALP